MEVRFEALEYRADGGFSPAVLRLEGDAATGWQLERNGRAHLGFGPGYELLAARACGVCATDLARRFLPFPLPQVIGHEVLAVGAAAERRVIEINASCEARGLTLCGVCAAGRGRHCPERRVLGIHDLPGGFGPFVLSPRRAALPVPDALPDETATLVEPFAAALHAVRTVSPRRGDRVLVLGPRRLGMLVVAALAAERRRLGTSFEIVAGVRRPELGRLASELGADTFEVVSSSAPPGPAFDVAIDTTGAPEGLTCALASARREVHLKSTHGQPAGGLGHVTEMVVDELRIAPFDADLVASEASGRPVAWLSAGEPPRGLAVERGTPAVLEGGAPYAAAVVDRAAAADAAIRPDPARESSLLAAGGTLWVEPGRGVEAAPLLEAVATRGLVVSTSRCGDFGEALSLLAADSALAEIGPRLVTHRFGPEALAEAFRTAASPEARKVLIVHPQP
ncbi:MAG: alcohol dehydrogenase catalytic domain-containing protein [Deltaproteobacteria bacterium]|nr:alcohol dehydrogenase catalytic domain-containing protein [Deltaproteobacteria bacterium]MBW2445406.1 alcohol dehydrogenase catalytic domain-containing protein [Deltaproteobacteria bacterium]